MVEDSPVTLVFRVAVDSNGNSWNREEIYFAFEDETQLRFTVCDPNFPQNFCYTILSVNRFDEGTYTAIATSKLLFTKTRKNSYYYYQVKELKNRQEILSSSMSQVSIVVRRIRM